jgi:ketosteroid isomerase-like protein
MRTKNLGDISDLLLPDAEFIDPDGKQYRGSTAIRTLYSQVFETYDSDIVINPRTLSPAGSIDGCVDSGIFKETLRLRSNGSAQYFEGTYRFTYRHQSDGHWLISRQEWFLH